MATERRREMGIRIAARSGPSSVVALVMKQGLQLTIIGRRRWTRQARLG